MRRGPSSCLGVSVRLTPGVKDLTGGQVDVRLLGDDGAGRGSDRRGGGWWYLRYHLSVLDNGLV